MNEIAPVTETENLSEDQRAVADYFSSDTYSRTRTRRQRLPRPPRRPVWPDRVLTPATSFGMGLAGLSAMLLIFSLVSPALTGMLRSVMDAGGSYIAFTILDQTTMYPTMIGFTFAIVTPMFWYGSIVTRFVLAAVMIVPGYLGFLYASSQALDTPDGFWLDFTAALLAMFLMIATIPVLAQMSSHWTLSHSRPMDSRFNPTSTRSIMELTGVTALACTVLFSLDTSEFAETLLLYVVFGALSAVAVVSMLIAFLRPERRNLFAAAISALFAFGGSFVYSGMHAFTEFGWDQLPGMLLLIVIVSIYGTVVYACVMWLYVVWLRSCGWACVTREDEKDVREAESKGPWHHWFGS